MLFSFTTTSSFCPFQVVFRVLPPFIQIENPYTEEVQDLLKMTDLRVNFTHLHTLGQSEMLLDFYARSVTAEMLLEMLLEMSPEMLFEEGIIWWRFISPNPFQ